MEKKSIFTKFLRGVEVVGNKLPHPVSIFVVFSIVIIIISDIATRLGISVEYLGFKNGVQQMVNVQAISLLSIEGIQTLFTKALVNFTSFAPLGTVLVAMLGIGIADSTGLIGTALKALVLRTPKKFITPIVVFAGILSNVASDAGYVILIPLGAIIFLSVGRHPLAGLAAAFAGVSGGFSANLLINTLDALLSGISTTAAHMIDPNYTVMISSNFYFMAVSTFFITTIGTLVTDKIVEPSLGKYGNTMQDKLEEITPAEKKALNWALLSAIIYSAVMLALVLPTNGVLRGKDGAFLTSPFISSIVIIMALFFFIPGVAYGIALGKIKSDKDIVTALNGAMSSMGSYMVLTFFAAQFIFAFSYSNLGTILSVTGANFLKATGFTGMPLIIAFVLLAAFINLFMGSASAKWAIMAPIFIPMLMQVGYAPEFVQLAYRIGDSATNIITPLMSYFAMIVAFAAKYDIKGKKEAGLGTITSMMLPYSMFFLIAWIILLIIWSLTGLPIGIGGNIHL
ncbi:MAG: AbgT family transporter [Treponemataceae bacterium]